MMHVGMQAALVDFIKAFDFVAVIKLLHKLTVSPMVYLVVLLIFYIIIYSEFISLTLF